MKELKHLELFAGIGGFRTAINLFCKDNGIRSTCVGFSEKDKFAQSTYKANFDTFEELDIGDIGTFTTSDQNIRSLPDFDLLSGGFPCQAFSIMGKKLGFDDLRGNIFYSIIHILKVKQPKYVLLENVRNLKNHNNRKTYTEIVRSLNDDAGYNVASDLFNTSDYGLPQHRRRIFILATRKDLSISKKLSKQFTHENVHDAFIKANNTSLSCYKNVLDGILDKNVDKKYYLSEKIKRTILADGSKNFRSKSEINQLIARPLTATMVKMHRACQDNYYSDAFLLSHSSESNNTLLRYSADDNHQNIRKLTPFEAFRLQGFNDNFVSNAIAMGISNHQLYKQAGNAVSVNVVYAILHFIFNTLIMEGANAEEITNRC